LCGSAYASGPGLDRAGEVMRQCFRGRRHPVHKRRTLLHPQRDAAVRILLLRCRHLVYNGSLRNLDIVGQIRTQIKAFMVFLGRRAQIAVEQHDIRDVFRVRNNIAYERRAGGSGVLWFLSHLVPPRQRFCQFIRSRQTFAVKCNRPPATVLAAHLLRTYPIVVFDDLGLFSGSRNSARDF
jgi:hypothetical protein